MAGDVFGAGRCVECQAHGRRRCGFLGGLAPATADVATLLDAAGKDIVLIETVGVGQDEIDIVRLADVTIVILVPGMGDDVQTIKAGIMEIADIFVINKSDREGADRVEREIRAMQTLAIRRGDWTPPIIKTVASEGTGVLELVKTIASYLEYLEGKDLTLHKKVSNWRERLVEMLRTALLCVIAIASFISLLTPRPSNCFSTHSRARSILG